MADLMMKTRSPTALYPLITARDQLLHRRQRVNKFGVDGVYYDYEVNSVPSSGR
jgi:hypothetical protein